MEEIGLPCSVITSHGECTLQPSSASTQPAKVKLEDNSSLTVYEIVNVNVWPSDTALLPNSASLEDEDPVSRPRNRKLKRPYSPEVRIGNKRLAQKRVGLKKSKGLQTEEVSNLCDMGSSGKPFSCDKCHSPFIVNPARSHRQHSRRKYRPRKITDPVSMKVLQLCNACGLSMLRMKKEKHKKDPPSQEDKSSYLTKAAEFAASLAASLKDPDASRLYCPAFKMAPCQCLQKYISGDDKNEVESERRAIHLLTLFKEARRLARQKNVELTSEDGADSCKQMPGAEKQAIQKVQRPRGLQKRKSKEFEEFVLKNRHYLREEVHLCERGTQRVLMYSNNFLHKKLKTSPNRTCRVERINGKNVRGLLKPIAQLAGESCCSDKCVMLVLTHSKLLETWRATAKLGQREARRVLAEMLTPSGGTKANCYKFISMVTGCSYATICLVNEQMRQTQGEREPPEHGLKKWWRDHPREKQKSICRKSKKSDNNNENDPGGLPDVSSIHIPTREELDSLCPQEASNHLQLQREKLLKIKKQLSAQQTLLRQAKTKLLEPSVTPVDTNECTGEVVSRSSAQQLLHILELPTPTPSVITSLAAQENAQSQPTISVMTSTGDFEPLTNISVSNVVILPEAALDNGSAAQGTSVISYSSAVETPAICQEQQPTDAATSLPDATKTNSPPVGTFQLYGVMDATASNLVHFNY